MARVFPTLPKDLERGLRAVKMVAETDPGYFNDPGCPYSEELKGYLRLAVMPPVVGERVQIFTGDIEKDGTSVLDEVQAIIEDMKAIEVQLADAEPGDRIAFLKSKTQMLERWVSLKEKIYNMKHLSDFQRVVIGVLDEMLEKDDQQEFKKRLKGIMGHQ